MILRLLKLGLVGLSAQVHLMASADISVRDWTLALDDLTTEHASIAGQYGHRRDAARIVRASISAAQDLPVFGSDTTAVLLVFAAYESEMRACAVGDGGQSLGAWQIKNAPRVLACDPDQAARIWLLRAQEAISLCPDNGPDEGLAVLASGSCDRAKEKVRLRMQQARRLTRLAQGKDAPLSRQEKASRP